MNHQHKNHRNNLGARTKLKSRGNPVAGLIILASLLAITAGTGRLISLYFRPPAVEVADLKYVQLLRTAVSNQEQEGLSKLQAVLQRKREANEIQENLFHHFQSIIDLAIGGDWDKAEAACRRFENAQQYRSR